MNFVNGENWLISIEQRKCKLQDRYLHPNLNGLFFDRSNEFRLWFNEVIDGAVFNILFKHSSSLSVQIQKNNYANNFFKLWVIDQVM